MTATLVLLNGSPVSGKRPIARLLADDRPVALDLDRADAVAVFEARRRNTTRAEHHDALQQLLDGESRCHRVTVVRGDIDTTVSAVRSILADHGIDWSVTEV